MKKKNKSKNKKHESVNVELFKAPYADFVYCLVTSDKELKHLCKKVGIKKSMLPMVQSAGQCISLGQDSGNELNIVVLYPNKEYTQAEHLGLLVHEINHAKRHYMEFIGETEPSDEFECYTIQEMVVNLSDELLHRLNKLNNE